MDGSIKLSKKDRKVLLSLYRNAKSARISRRAHIVLLIADGYSWRTVIRLTFSSNNFVRRTLESFREDGVEGLNGMKRKSVEPPVWVAQARTWLEEETPRDHGYFRTRWTCGLIADMLAWNDDEPVRVSAETVRRWLKRDGYSWSRPRPILGLRDDEYDRKIRRIRRLLSRLPSTETAVFQDEVDINLNPKIGAAWSRRGQQITVETPGNNVKRYVYGSLSWRTGRLHLSEACRRRNSEFFIKHLDDLRCQLRGYRHIHVICDNASFHSSRVVREYLEEMSHRFTIHFLPAYAPESNPIERVWWHMHEVVTRNHQCADIDELVDQVYEWFAEQKFFEVKTTIKYPLAA